MRDAFMYANPDLQAVSRRGLAIEPREAGLRSMYLSYAMGSVLAGTLNSQQRAQALTKGGQRLLL